MSASAVVRGSCMVNTRCLHFRSKKSLEICDFHGSTGEYNQKTGNWVPIAYIIINLAI